MRCVLPDDLNQANDNDVGFLTISTDQRSTVRYYASPQDSPGLQTERSDIPTTEHPMQ